METMRIWALVDYYELVHFIPVSLWNEIKGRIAGCEKDTYICILGKENATLEELNSLQSEIDRKFAGRPILFPFPFSC